MCLWKILPLLIFNLNMIYSTEEDLYFSIPRVHLLQTWYLGKRRAITDSFESSLNDHKGFGLQLSQHSDSHLDYTIGTIFLFVNYHDDSSTMTVHHSSSTNHAVWWSFVVFMFVPMYCNVCLVAINGNEMRSLWLYGITVLIGIHTKNYSRNLKPTERQI